MGSSKPWQEAMEAITGGREMSVGSLVTYFQPLLKWLKDKNAENGDVLGWSEENWKPSACAVVL